MARRMTAMIAALLGLATIAGIAPAPAHQGGPAACANPTFVEAVGWACPTPDGLWLLTLEDGTIMTTHGPDYFPPRDTGIHGNNEILDVRRRKPSCVTQTDSQYHIQLVYTSTLDTPDRFGARLGYLRRMMERVNGLLYKEGAEFGAPMLYRMACVRGEVSVLNAKLDIPSGANQGALGTLGGISTALRRKGYTNPFAKYWLFVDAPPPFPNLGGVANFIADDRLVAHNASNFGPGYGVFWDVGEAFTTVAMMHEASHLQGAIQSTAPNSSSQYGGGAHCVDDSDVMCYPENEGVEQFFNYNKCARMHFDCGHNDYFNPRPRGRNYLRTAWNLGSPLNRFYAGCMYRTDEMTLGTAGQDVDAVIRPNVEDWDNLAVRSYGIARRCRNRPYALSGVVSPQPREADAIVGLLPDTHEALFLLRWGPPDHLINERAAPDFNVCFYRGKTQLRCDTAIGTDQGTVPRNATRALINFNAGADGMFFFSVV